MKGVNILSPRPRSRDKIVPISIGIPLSLMMRLSNELEYTQSRSKWVCHAIKEKLNQQFDLTSIPTRQLIGMLHARNIISTELLTSLVMRVGEIEGIQ